MLLHSPFLQHPLILFLGATTLAAPLGPEEVAAELPNSIQNTFYCHKLKISSGLCQLSYSAFRTANAFSMSSKLTVPPHMRWTYSGVMPARSIEQERISFSINSRRRATNSSFTLFFIILSMLLRPNHACLFVGDFPPSCKFIPLSQRFSPSAATFPHSRPPRRSLETVIHMLPIRLGGAA